MTPRGGARLGAGRKALRGEAKKQVGIWLTPGQHTWLGQQAEAQGRSRSELIADAIEAARAGQSAASVPALAPELAAWLDEYAAQSGQTAAEALAGILSRFRAAVAALMAPGSATGQRITMDVPDDVWNLLLRFADGDRVKAKSGTAARLILMGAALLGADQQ